MPSTAVVPRRTESRWTKLARNSSPAFSGIKSCGMRRPVRRGLPCNRSSTRTGTEIQSQIQNKQTNTTKKHTNYYYYYIYEALPTFEFTVYLYLKSITYWRVVMTQNGCWPGFLLSLLPLRSLLDPLTTRFFPLILSSFYSVPVSSVRFKVSMPYLLHFFFYFKNYLNESSFCFLFCSVVGLVSSHKRFID